MCASLQLQTQGCCCLLNSCFVCNVKFYAAQHISGSIQSYTQVITTDESVLTFVIRQVEGAYRIARCESTIGQYSCQFIRDIIGCCDTCALVLTKYIRIDLYRAICFAPCRFYITICQFATNFPSRLVNRIGSSCCGSRSYCCGRSCCCGCRASCCSSGRCLTVANNDLQRLCAARFCVGLTRRAEQHIGPTLALSIQVIVTCKVYIISTFCSTLLYNNIKCLHCKLIRSTSKRSSGAQLGHPLDVVVHICDLCTFCQVTIIGRRQVTGSSTTEDGACIICICCICIRIIIRIMTNSICIIGYITNIFLCNTVRLAGYTNVSLTIFNTLPVSCSEFYLILTSRIYVITEDRICNVVCICQAAVRVGVLYTALTNCYSCQCVHWVLGCYRTSRIRILFILA